MTLTAETTSELAGALAKVGLELGSPDPGLASSLPGPIVNLAGVDGGIPVLVAAVADKPTIQADSIIQSIGGAISRVRPELALRPMDPVADLNDLVGSVGAPASIFPISGNGEIIGAIVWSEDRRSGGPDQAADAIRAAGSVAGAAAGGTISSMSANASQLTRLRDVQLSVTVELGRTSMSVSDVLSLEIGSVIELDRAAGAPIDVRVNGTLLARGEVVVVDDEYAIRVTEMIDPDRG